MPYVFLKSRTYKGVECKPGDTCPDLKPKRSLVTMKVLKWEPATGTANPVLSSGEPEIQPLAKVGDRSIDHAIPPRPPEPPKPEPTDRQKAVERLTEQTGAPQAEVEELADSMSQEELGELLSSSAAIAEKPEPEPIEDTSYGSHIDDKGNLLWTDVENTGLLEDDEPEPEPEPDELLSSSAAITEEPEPEAEPRELAEGDLPVEAKVELDDVSKEEAAEVGLLTDDHPEPETKPSAKEKIMNVFKPKAKAKRKTKARKKRTSKKKG